VAIAALADSAAMVVTDNDHLIVAGKLKTHVPFSNGT
jgi:hypothetical protein